MTDRRFHNNNKNYKRSRSRSLDRNKHHNGANQRTNKLHINKLPINITESELQREFENISNLKEIKIIKTN